MRHSFLMLLMVGLMLAGASQAEEITGKIGRFRGSMSDGTLLEGQRGYFTTSSFIFRHNDGTKDTLALDKVGALEEFKGHSGDTYGAIGALAGLAAGFYISYSSEYLDVGRGSDWDNNAIEIVAGLTIAGSSLGYLLGSSRQRWEGVPISVGITGRAEDRTGFLMVSVGL